MAELGQSAYSFATIPFFIVHVSLELQINFADHKPESIPALLHDVIERLLNVQAISVKPDSCVVDIFNEVAPDIFTFKNLMIC